MMCMMNCSGWSRVVGALTLGGFLMVAGCAEPHKRLNAPPQGASNHPHKMADQYTYMNDNALLAEMSMSPAHFLDGRPDLNGSGLRRLNRYAELLQQYGGTLHYDGVEDPEPLADQRMEKIRSFLAQSGVDQKSCKVERGLAGGKGMRGQEAGEIRRAADYSPEKAQRQSKGGAWNQGILGGGGGGQ